MKWPTINISLSAASSQCAKTDFEIDILKFDGGTQKKNHCMHRTKFIRTQQICTREIARKLRHLFIPTNNDHTTLK